MASPLGKMIALAARSVGRDTTEKNPAETSWNTVTAAITTVAPGAGVLAGAAATLAGVGATGVGVGLAAVMAAYAFSPEPGMWGNTAAQIGGVERRTDELGNPVKGEIEDTEQEWIKMWRNGDKVHIRMQNIATADSFFLHASSVPDWLIETLSLSLPGLALSLSKLKKNALNNDGKWRPIVQIFDWELDVPEFKGYCGKG